MIDNQVYYYKHIAKVIKADSDLWKTVMLKKLSKSEVVGVDMKVVIGNLRRRSVYYDWNFFSS